MLVKEKKKNFVVLNVVNSKIGKLCSTLRDNETAFKTYFLSSQRPELNVSLRENKAMIISDGTTGLTSWTA